MKNCVLATALYIALFHGVNLSVHAQIIDPGKADHYNKVFLETDNFGASYLDSLQLGWQRVGPDRIKMEILNDLAYYWHTRNLKRSEQLSLQGIKLAADLRDTLALGRFQSTLGAVLLRMEKLDSALFVLKRARSRIGPEDLPFLLTQMGYVYERRGALDDAADYAMEALKIAEANQDYYGMAVAYSDMSNLFWKQEKYEKGLDYGL
ncbi:MAG: histidine kinase, partial [Eudoraea sp.]|nr:histidine kinase [Eudoraea sp.]